MTGEIDVVFALNHWNTAIATHSANNPGTKHVNSRLDMTSPGECEPIDILYASPECTHHSRARGGRPTTDQQRAGSWDVLKWIEFHRPSYVIVENVWEITKWGPVGKDGRPLKSHEGKFFEAWIAAVKGAGYRAEFQKLNSANYGAWTSRERFILIARKGNRAPVWPEVTHSRDGGGIPGLGLPRWRAAAECIDWSVPCPSIFARARELAPNTLARIEAGLRRFVGPFVVKFSGHEHSESLARPVSTIRTSGAHHGLAVPFTVQWDNQGGNGDYVRRHDVPHPTITTKANAGIAMPFMLDVNHAGGDRVYDIGQPCGTVATHNGRALAVPFICGCGARDGQTAPASVGSPLNTIVTKDAKCIAVPFLTHFYGTNNISPVTDPLDTITTHDRHSVCVAAAGRVLNWPEPQSEAMRSLQATMRELGVADIGFRMWQNHELSAAQSFPRDYVFHGTKAEITKQIGNSVPPLLAKAVSLACV